MKINNKKFTFYLVILLWGYYEFIRTSTMYWNLCTLLHGIFWKLYFRWYYVHTYVCSTRSFEWYVQKIPLLVFCNLNHFPKSVYYTPGRDNFIFLCTYIHTYIRTYVLYITFSFQMKKVKDWYYYIFSIFSIYFLYIFYTNVDTYVHKNKCTCIMFLQINLKYYQ